MHIPTYVTFVSRVILGSGNRSQTKELETWPSDEDSWTPAPTRQCITVTSVSGNSTPLETYFEAERQWKENWETWSDQAYELASTHPALTSWGQPGFQQTQHPLWVYVTLADDLSLVPSATGWLQFQAKLRPLIFRRVNHTETDIQTTILGAGEMALWLLFQNPDMAAHHCISSSRGTDTLAQTYMQYTWKFFN